MDERLFGSLSDRVRLASDEVEMVMRAEVRELIARRIRDEVDLFPAAASVRADGRRGRPPRAHLAPAHLLSTPESGGVAGMVPRAGSDALPMSLRSTAPVDSSAASIRPIGADAVRALTSPPAHRFPARGSP